MYDKKIILILVLSIIIITLKAEKNINDSIRRIAITYSPLDIITPNLDVDNPTYIISVITPGCIFPVSRKLSLSADMGYVSHSSVAGSYDHASLDKSKANFQGRLTCKFFFKETIKKRRLYVGPEFLYRQLNYKGSRTLDSGWVENSGGFMSFSTYSSTGKFQNNYTVNVRQVALRIVIGKEFTFKNIYFDSSIGVGLKGTFVKYNNWQYEPVSPGSGWSTFPQVDPNLKLLGEETVSPNISVGLKVGYFIR